MVKQKNTVLVALTAAVAIDGEICVAGSELQVEQNLAKELLNRGRCALVEEHGMDAESEEIDLATLNKQQLVELAIEYGIENPEQLTVAQLLEKITEANNAEGAE